MKITPTKFQTAFRLIALFVPFVMLALVMVSERGDWPTSWPQELETLRSQSRTIQVATGLNETVYEISFTSREEFLRVWPVLLKLKSANGTAAPALHQFSAGNALSE